MDPRDALSRAFSVGLYRGGRAVSKLAKVDRWNVYRRMYYQLFSSSSDNGGRFITQ